MLAGQDSFTFPSTIALTALALFFPDANSKIFLDCIISAIPIVIAFVGTSSIFLNSLELSLIVLSGVAARETKAFFDKNPSL